MLLQTNSYIVPREKREEHARLVRKFRQVLLRLGCESFDVYEQVGTNWGPGEATGRYVQIMRFVDRRSQQAVQAAEKSDKGAQHVIAEFCELINFPYQQQQGLFAVGFYTSVLPILPVRTQTIDGVEISTSDAGPLPTSEEIDPNEGNPDMIDLEAVEVERGKNQTDDATIVLQDVEQDNAKQNGTASGHDVRRD